MSGHYRRGIAANSAAEIAGRAFALAGGIVLAKILSPELFGRFFSDQALVLVGSGVYNLGLAQGYRQIVSREQDLRNEYLGPTILLRLMALTTYGTILATYYAVSGKLSAPTVLVAAGTLALSLVELVQIELLMFRRYAAAAAVAVGKGAVILLPAIGCWLLGGLYPVFTWGYAAVVLITVAGGLTFVRPAFHAPSPGVLRRLSKTSAPFIAAIAAFAFTNSWGLHYVRTLLGSGEAGIYAVPWKVYQAAMVIGMSVSAVSLPLLHRLSHEGDEAALTTVFARLVKAAIAFSGMVAGLCVIAPGLVIRMVATPAYLSAAGLLPYLSAAFVLRLTSIPAENLLEGRGRQGARVLVLVAGAVVALGGVMSWVPTSGITGAARAALAADAVIFVGMWLFAVRAEPGIVRPGPTLSHLAILTLLVIGIRHVASGSTVAGAGAFIVAWGGFALGGLGLWREFRGMVVTRKSGD